MHRVSTLSFRLAVLVALVLGPCAGAAHAEALTLVWDRSSEAEVVGYFVYIGNTPGTYTEQVNVGNATEYVVNTTAGKQYCFAVSAYFAGPVEGSRSTEVCTAANGAPTLANPGNQSHALGAAVSLPLSATDPESAPLTFSAVGLPPGLALAPSSGAISGTPTQAGTFPVTAKVSDGTLYASVAFSWTITASGPVAPTLLAPSGSIATTTPTFEWRPVATATRYRLWVDDNSSVNPRVQVDLTPLQAGCADEGSVCRHNPGIALAAGPASWSVRATNAVGDGPWTGAMDFSIADGRAPVVTIALPTTGTTHSTAATSVALGGTATDDVGVVQVTWANDRGGAGSATGTSTWSVASVPLSKGANVITVTARDAENNTSIDTLTVTRTDGQAPTVEITLPTTSGTHRTTDTALALGGTAADEFGVTEVRWANSRGGSGLANGTTSWGVPAVALQGGTNVITVTARDAGGNVATDSISVEVADGAAPSIAIVGPTSAATFSTTAATLALSGTASDAFGVTQVTWANSRGGSGTAAGTTGWTVAAIALQTGENVLTVTARDAAGQTATDSLTVTLTDGDSPVVTISAPTSNATHSTTQATIALGGTASDNFGVTEVRWVNDRGGSGAASGTTSWSVPSVALQGGVNTITVTARDASGRSGTDVISVTRTDGEAPTVSIVSPTSADTYSTTTPTLALSGTAGDAFGVAQVTWANSRGGNGIATGTTAWSVAGLSLQPGANVLTITARDTGGNTATDTVTVTLTDNVAPTVAVAAPTDAPTHSTSNATVALGGTASDAFGVTEVRWASDRGPSGVATGTGAWTVASVALSAGANLITVTARDAAGLSSTDTITITRTDGEAPTVAIATPTASPTHSVTTRTIALGGTASDTFGVAQVSWASDRGGSGVAVGTSTWSVAGVELQPGANVITVTARDAAGNVGRDALTVTLSDGVAPVVRITSPTSAGSFTTTTPGLTVAGTATDEFGVTRVSWVNDRGGSGTATGAATWSAAIALRPGTNAITVTATDAAGNNATATLSVVASDTTRPTATISAPLPKSRYVTTAATVGVTGTAGDDFGLARVTWVNDRGGSGSASGTTAWAVPDVALYPGANLITVTATDLAGNSAADTVKVFSDGRKPTVGINEPVSSTSYAVSSATLDLGGVSADDQGVTEVSWSNNRGGRGVAVGTTRWAARGVPLAAGINVLTVTATDEAGNTERATLTVVLDTRAPGVTIDSPTTSPTAAINVGSIGLRGTANDDVGVTQVSWSNDRGGSGAAAGATAWAVPGVALQPGRNVITVTARDAAGNSSTDTITVHYDTRAPVVTIAAPTAAATFATTSPGVALGGTASDDGTVAEVRWANSRGGSGVASGTTTWAVDRAALQAGVNEITITARDAAGNAASTRLIVTAKDALAPSVRISGPSPLDTFSTALRVVNLEGTSSDDFGVTQIAWASDRGTSGVARGTGSWIAGGVALQPGVNVIAVTALDAAGNSSSDVLRITVDGQLPVISIAAPASSSYSTETPAVTISGTASDDSGITQVTWASDRGTSGAAYGTTAWSTPSLRLEPGANLVTITARDGSGNSATATLSILYADAVAATAASPVSGGSALTPPAATRVVRDRAAELAPVKATASASSGASTASGASASKTSASSTPARSNDLPMAYPLPTSIPDPTPLTGARAGTARGRVPAQDAAPQDTESPDDAVSDADPTREQEAARPPEVSISAPSTSDELVTEDATITLAGIARDDTGIALVTWATDRGATGTAVGRNRWSVPDFALPLGTTIVTITARNAVGDLATDSLAIVRRPKSTLTLEVTSPTADSAWTTTASTVALRGTASDNVVKVSWAADWGGSGPATGTTQWTIPTIGLRIGTNLIALTAQDREGRTTEQVLKVTYRPGVAANASGRKGSGLQ